jgi:hypothetical protein
MELTIVASREVFERAMAAAARLGDGEEISGLAAPLDSIRGFLEEAWTVVGGALRKAYQWGKDRVQDVLDAAVVKVEELMERVGSKARDLQAALLARINAFVREEVFGTLALVPTEFKVGERTFALTTLKCSQKLMMSGSVKANLMEVFSLVSSGEIVVEANYADAAAKDRPPTPPQ